MKTWVRTALKMLRDELRRGGRGMTHDELRDMYEFYALGLLEPEEQRRDRRPSQAGMRNLQGRSPARRRLRIPRFFLVPDVAPPKRLRRRVLAGFGHRTPELGLDGRVGRR